MCGARDGRSRERSWKSGGLIDASNSRDLDELFVRYWENDLSQADAVMLRDQLAIDESAREAFQLFCLQTIMAGELPPVAQAVAVSEAIQANHPAPAPLPTGWSRRRLLRYVSGGAAALALGGYIGRLQLGRSMVPSSVRVSAIKGEVALRTASGRNIPPLGQIPPGGTLSTLGPVSTAVLRCPDGTDVSFTGDSEVAVPSGGTRLILLHGTATAAIPPHRVGPKSMVLQTAHAALSRPSGVVLTMARTRRGTEVGVQNGMVVVDSPSGEALGVVRAGEILTVRADGDRSKQLTLVPPDHFAWNLDVPLPPGWNVGQREQTVDGPVVVPELWLDPYYQVEMFQVRSDHQWAKGFFRLYPDSVIRVRYWVDRPGSSQIVLCVRTASYSDSATAVLECNGAFSRARPQSWQVLEFKVSDMLDNIHGPKFEPPWVGFLVIFNTFRSDIGLKIAEFEVIGPAPKKDMLSAL